MSERCLCLIGLTERYISFTVLCSWVLKTAHGTRIPYL